MNELNHLAIIMDGNGRWAQKRNLKRTDGHKAGVKVVREISIWAAQNNISYLSLYAFSTENWLRPKMEVDFLMKLLENYLESEAKTYAQNNIRFKVIGDISVFSARLKERIYSLEDSTRKNSALTQILALNYGSRDEIARAFLNLDSANLDSARDSMDLDSKNLDSTNPKAKDSKKITKQEILKKLESCLDTAGIPDVDLLIRTGGEMRLSNFLLYQSAYAELFFSPTLFPDFDTKELCEIVENYKQRNRRFGSI